MNAGNKTQSTLNNAVPQSRYFARNVKGNTKNKSKVNSRSGYSAPNAATNPSAAADAPTDRPRQYDWAKQLRTIICTNSADDAAGQKQDQKFFAAKRFFNCPAENVNCPAIEQNVHQSGVHELKRQQLPDEAVLQSINAQREIIDPSDKHRWMATK